jgi:predicted CXXCH cytochrome family protein
MNRQAASRGFLFVLAVGVSVALAGIPAHAGHDQGMDCYECHSLRGGDIWAGSFSIATSMSIGGSSYSDPLRCDFCHTDKAVEFGSAWESAHPVQLIEGDNVSVMANTASSTALDCHYCHRGNTVVGDPNPDLAPAYYGLSGNYGTDGYPDHHVDGTPDNVVNPGDPPHLGTIDNTNRVYVKSPASLANLTGATPNYELCFYCHDGSDKTTRRKNIKQDYIDQGHYFKASGDRMPCSDCHDSHASETSSRLMSPNFTTGSWTPVVYDNIDNPSDNNIRAMCIGCHDDYNPTNTGNGTPKVRDVEPSPRKHGLTGHADEDTQACTQCHNPHKTSAGGPDCFTCHTAGGAAEAKGYGYIDNLFKDVGLDADNTANKPASDPSNGYEWSQHGGFDGTGNARFKYQFPYDKPNNDCQKCHGERHKEAKKLIHPDPNDTGGEAFTPADSLQVIPVDNANNFCLACHDGDGDAADIQIGDVDPPEVNRTNWTGKGHGKDSGSYDSGNSAANLKCIACHEVHGSNHAKLLAADNTTTPPGDLQMPPQFAEKTVGSTAARDLDFRDYTDPVNANPGASGDFDNNWKSSKGLGTTGDPANQYGPDEGNKYGLCDACHRDSGSVSVDTLNKARGPGVPDVVHPGLHGMPQSARDDEPLDGRGQHRDARQRGGRPECHFLRQHGFQFLRRRRRGDRERWRPVHGVPRQPGGLLPQRGPQLFHPRQYHPQRGEELPGVPPARGHGQRFEVRVPAGGGVQLLSRIHRPGRKADV